MRYIKKYEELTQNKIKIGDYVIIKDTFSKEDELYSWHNTYGQVKDIKSEKGVKSHYYYLVKIFDIEDYYWIDKSNEYIPYSLYLPKNRDETWVVDENIFKCKSKKDFDNEVAIIKMTKKAKKFNI